MIKIILISLACLAYCVSGKFHLHAMSSMPIRYGVARPTFFNDGRFYGWDNKHEESKGEMEEVRVGCFDNHIDSDSHCLRFEQVTSTINKSSHAYLLLSLLFSFFAFNAILSSLPSPMLTISFVFIPFNFIRRHMIQSIEVDIILKWYCKMPHNMVRPLTMASRSSYRKKIGSLTNLSPMDPRSQIIVLLLLNLSHIFVM